MRVEEALRVKDKVYSFVESMESIRANASGPLNKDLIEVIRKFSKAVRDAEVEKIKTVSGSIYYKVKVDAEVLNRFKTYIVGPEKWESVWLDIQENFDGTYTGIINVEL